MERTYPELDAVRSATDAPTYLVGGAVRDLLLGQGRSDVDLVVVGDAAALAAKLGAEVLAHERFATAKARLDGHELDVATARAERYPHPGALPEVEPAADIETDLRRRDFTINAMAIPLQGEPRLIDPHGGQSDLEAGQLRVLHPGSFVDDPTRALRAARYAARFGFELEQQTEPLLRQADLDAVSEDRRIAELRRLAAESAAAHGFELVSKWGLVDLRPGGVELAGKVSELFGFATWRELAPRDTTVLTAALGPAGGEEELVAAQPELPSQAVELARGHDPAELAIARALGADWLDRYLLEWRAVKLEIDGGDLVAAGVPQGPALGRGLAAALRRKLDGEIDGREAELEVALAVAREDG